MLDTLLKLGKKYVFISNIDNLGATVDTNIVNLMRSPPQGMSKPEFIMEVTDKTAADVKVSGIIIMSMVLLGDWAIIIYCGPPLHFETHRNTVFVCVKLAWCPCQESS